MPRSPSRKRRKRKRRKSGAKLAVGITLSIAAAAARQPRLGARALKEVFRRVIRDYEFDPHARLQESSEAILLDLAEVEHALIQRQRGD